MISIITQISMSALAGVLSLLITASCASAAKPVGEPLIIAEPRSLIYFGPGDPAPASVVKVVPVVGQDFSQALQVNTFGVVARPKTDFGLYARLAAPVKQGDVLWISFKARCLEAKRESGEAAFELRFDQLVNGKYKWPPYLERGVSVGREWTEVSIPYAMERKVGPADMRLAMSFDHYPQRFEIGPVTFINCGSNIRVTDLPRSVVRYGGSEPDAPWRAAAAERIEKFRKGELMLKVMDRDGRPVADAAVAVRMRRLDFLIGTAIGSRNMLDAASPDAQRYRKIVSTYFNHVVFDNDMKWPLWAAQNYKPEALLPILDWVKEHGLTARATPMVWPSWRHLPVYLKEFQNDPATLRREVFKNIERQTRVMKGRYVQWDVTNELFANHDLVDILGRDEIVAWYRAAQAGAPDVKLCYNEYTMFHPDGPGPEHFFETIKFLKEKGAPLQGLGEQAHVGGSPPGIPLVLARLERFAVLGYPITITEFDMNSNDEDFQASYMRDFMTAVFSNPHTEGLVQWGFWAGSHYFPSAGLWNKDWSLRKHGQAFVDMVTKTWRTDADGRTAVNGTYATRGFYGDYDVTVTHAGKTKTVRLKLAPGAAMQTITVPL